MMQAATAVLHELSPLSGTYSPGFVMVSRHRRPETMLRWGPHTAWSPARRLRSQKAHPQWVAVFEWFLRSLHYQAQQAWALWRTVSFWLLCLASWQLKGCSEIRVQLRRYRHLTERLAPRHQLGYLLASISFLLIAANDSIVHLLPIEEVLLSPISNALRRTT